MRLDRKSQRPLHRIAEVMRQECVSARTLGKRLNKTVGEVLADSQANVDMLLSELYEWQAALDVPVADLLVEPGLDLSPHVQHRGRLLKAMRTVRSIQEQAESDSIQLLALQLVEQLMEMMPELKDVPAWPAIGQRRTLDDLGAVVDHPYSERCFNDHGADV